VPPVDANEPLGRPLEARRVAALVPCHRVAPERSLVEAIRRQVGGVLLVDDGCPELEARAVEQLARETEVSLLRLAANTGKGHALAAGLRHLLSRSPPAQAVVVLDADGQHPPEVIPAFLAAAAEAELVIGDRLSDAAGMPWQRRLANRIAARLLALTSAAPVRDSQCGMRLLRGRALLEVEFPGGGYEAETRHLKGCLRRGLRVAWVPIPAVYEGRRSSFRRCGTRCASWPRCSARPRRMCPGGGRGEVRDGLG
jgi:dolichol-phosphate mannosyltransferase